MEGMKIIGDDDETIQDERETDLFYSKVYARLSLSVFCLFYIAYLFLVEFR